MNNIKMNEKEKELFDIMKKNCMNINSFIITYKIVSNGILKFTVLCDYAISYLNQRICDADSMYRYEKHMHGNIGPSISKVRKIKKETIHNATLTKKRIKTIALELDLKLHNN